MDALAHLVVRCWLCGQVPIWIDLAAAGWAQKREDFVDAGNQHGPEVAGWALGWGKFGSESNCIGQRLDAMCAVVEKKAPRGPKSNIFKPFRPYAQVEYREFAIKYGASFEVAIYTLSLPVESLR